MFPSFVVKNSISQVIGSKIAGIKTHAGSFGGDEKGAVAMTFGLSTIALMMFVGAAVDFGRWLNVKSQTRAAIDSAVLAGARTLQVSGNDTQLALRIARSYYKSNIKARARLSEDTIDFNIAADGKTLSASGNAKIKTPFLSLVSIKSLNVLSNSGAEQSKATFVLGGSEEQKIEISMMLDTTGSMSGQKIIDLKSAAGDLIDIVLPDNSGAAGSVRVAIAPFAEAVRPGTGYLNMVRQASANTLTFKNKQGKSVTYKLSECVSERDGSAAFNDAAPVGGDMFGPVYTSNGSCTTTSKIVPLTSDKASLKTAVNGLVASGSTAGHIGSAWAWYLLSPNWASIWPTASRPAEYSDATVKKIAILMTDGEYNIQYDAKGLATSVSGAGSAMNGASDTQARNVCEKLKMAGVEVYTVGFDLQVQSAIDTLRNCASDPDKAYVAQDGDQLRNAFRDIAVRLSPLRLTN